MFQSMQTSGHTLHFRMEWNKDYLCNIEYQKTLDTDRNLTFLNNNELKRSRTLHRFPILCMYLHMNTIPGMCCYQPAARELRVLSVYRTPCMQQ
mmetsp:Transcript_111336/g.218204  ORF Transcript_111336/g.218204 Transcript_111336/m.218204 type:complete len:94 (-) Transcript_111336:85-366(-)